MHLDLLSGKRQKGSQSAHKRANGTWCSVPQKPLEYKILSVLCVTPRGASDTPANQARRAHVIHVQATAQASELTSIYFGSTLAQGVKAPNCSPDTTALPSSILQEDGRSLE